jgi:hypothetical protein
MAKGSKAYMLGYDTTDAISMLRFLPATNNYNALIKFPYSWFQKIKPLNERYERGEVLQDNGYKYLAENDNISVDPGRPLEEQFKLFRDPNAYDEDGTPRLYVPKEYCLKGFPRWYESESRPEDTGWWEVYSDRVDSAIPPPSDGQNWRFIGA